MEKAYLRNGEEVSLHVVLPNGEFIIERMFYYEDYEGNGECEPNGVKEVVKEIFTKPPIEKKHDDLIKIIEKTETKNKELAEVETQIRLAKNELRESERFKTDLQKHIIDRSELIKAKSITVFSGFNAYTVTEDREKRSIKLSYRISVFEGKMDVWVCKLDWEGRSHYSETINLKYGLLIDATDEQILEIGKEIVRESKEISDNELLSDRIPKDYLTDDLINRKNELEKAREKTDIENLEKEIKDKQTKLKELKK